MRPIKKKGSKVKAKPLPLEVTKEEFREVQATIREIQKKRKYFMANLLAWGSGLRISEVLNVKQGDFNWDDKSIRVNMGKNSKDRIVPIPKGFRKETNLKYLPISCGVRALQKAFIKYAEESGVKKNKPKVHFHSLRHGFATHCLRKGVKPPAIKLMMGHEDLSTTAIYMNLVPKEALNEYQEKF